MGARFWVILILIGSLLSLLLAPTIGGTDVPLQTLWNASSDETSRMIFWDIRLPRAVLAWVAGAGLAVAGMAFQAMFRNALATPFTLGVSSGASMGATLGIRLGLSFSLLGLSATSLCAMLGALLAISLVYGLTRLNHTFSNAAMLLAGVAVNFFFSSIILLIQYTSNYYDTFRILRWLMGGLQLIGFDSTVQVLIFVAIGVLVLAYFIHELNLLTLGSELAMSRGLHVQRLKTILFLTVSIMVGAVVAVCGPIGFIGLMVPHICRLIIGSDHRHLLPAVAFFGGGFLVVCDTLARTIFFPTELPVGIITSFLGGPFFLWLLLRPNKNGSVIV